MNNKPFESIDEVDDVRILIKVKGKHYSIVPKVNDVITSEECKEVRIGILRLLLEFHEIVDTPLEDIKEKIQEIQELIK